MQRKIRVVLAFMIMVGLLAVSVMWGAYKGWSAQRQQVESSMGTLYEMLRARQEIGHNILTVARRHLSEEDELARSLREDIAQLGSDGDFEYLAEVNARFERDALALLGHLGSQLSLKADERDSMYATQMLPQALEESARMTEQAEYNRQAAAFNQDIKSRFSGRIARALGVDEAQQFLTRKEGQ